MEGKQHHASNTRFTDGFWLLSRGAHRYPFDTWFRTKCESSNSEALLFLRWRAV